MALVALFLYRDLSAGAFVNSSWRVCGFCGFALLECCFSGFGAELGASLSCLEQRQSEDGAAQAAALRLGRLGVLG